MTAAKLSERENVGIDAIRQRWRKVSTAKFDRNRELTETEISALISPNENREILPVPKQRKPKGEISHDGETAKEQGETVTKAEHEKPKAAKRDWTDYFLFVVMCFGLCGQMAHTYSLAARNLSGYTQAQELLISLLVAITVDCTALILTMKKGGYGYLITFACFHYLVNVQVYGGFETADWSKHLLSLAVAFSNFSYTEIFSEKK